MSTVGYRIRQKREQRGWSQSEFARRMNAAGWPTHYQVTVSRTEKNERPLRLDEAVAVAEILGVTLDWLARAEGDEVTYRYANGHRDGYRDGIEAARNALDGLTA